MEQAPKVEGNAEGEKEPVVNEGISDEREAEIEKLIRAYPAGEHWLVELRDIGDIHDAGDAAELDELLSEISSATGIPKNELSEFQHYFSMGKLEKATPEDLARQALEIEEDKANNLDR